MAKGKLDRYISEVMLLLDEERKKLKVDRVNSTMLLKALLEASESPLYDALVDYIYDITDFPDLLDETYSYIPQGEVKPENTGARMELAASGQKIKLVFDEDLSEVMGIFFAWLQVKDNITIKDFTAIFVTQMPFNVLKIFRTFGVNTTYLKKEFEKYMEMIENGEEPEGEKATQKQEETETKASSFKMPDQFKGFVRNLNEEFAGTSCDISGRDKECKFVWQTLMKNTKKNVVLIGEPGVGKTSIVQKITHDIISGNCPKEFKDFVVLSLDVTSSVAGTMFRGQAEERYSAFAEFLEKQKNVIVFIDEIHLIKGAGACREGEIDLANALKPVLAGGKVRIIGATTNEEYEKYFSQDAAIKRRFRPITVREPQMAEVYPMLQKSIETLSEYHGVSISKKMVDFIILNAACFNSETSNPDRTKDLIDLSMVAAKQAGKSKVDRKCVLENFEYHFEKFAKMSEASKRSTAYHEAGHCLVAIFSENLTNYDVVAVSIMPTDTYLGVTVFEDNENTVEPTKQYFVDVIARCLAGRVAEKMFTKNITSGAAADLEEATRIAQNFVTKYGMAKFGMNRIYTAENQSEEAKNCINAEIDKLIEMANQRAEQILDEHHETLELLVEALMKNGIVGKNDLEKILKAVKQN